MKISAGGGMSIHRLLIYLIINRYLKSTMVKDLFWQLIEVEMNIIWISIVNKTILTRFI